MSPWLGQENDPVLDLDRFPIWAIVAIVLTVLAIIAIIATSPTMVGVG